MPWHEKDRMDEYKTKRNKKNIKKTCRIRKKKNVQKEKINDRKKEKKFRNFQRENIKCN